MAAEVVLVPLLPETLEFVVVEGGGGSPSPGPLEAKAEPFASVRAAAMTAIWNLHFITHLLSCAMGRTGFSYRDGCRWLGKDCRPDTIAVRPGAERRVCQRRTTLPWRSYQTRQRWAGSI